MQVNKIMNGEISYSDIPAPTNEDMQREYDYILAEQLTKKLFDQGLISSDEFDKIMARNRKSFSPYFPRI